MDWFGIFRNAPYFLSDQHQKTRYETYIPIPATIAWITWVFCQWINSDLALNEQGDFFAGFVSPIAILWLVLGYLQQGKELRLNTQALELQIKELNDSVKQQSIIATVALAEYESSKKTAAEAEYQKMLSSQPKASTEEQISLGNSLCTIVMTINNLGALARGVIFSTDCQHTKLNHQEVGFLPKNGSHLLTIHRPRKIRTEFCLYMAYTDDDGHVRSQRCHIVPSGPDSYKGGEFSFS